MLSFSSFLAIQIEFWQQVFLIIESCIRIGPYISLSEDGPETLVGLSVKMFVQDGHQLNWKVCQNMIRSIEGNKREHLT